MKQDLYRTGKAYTIGEAARYVGIHPNTVRGWLRGYRHAAGVRSEPVLSPTADKDSPWVSFLQLAELAIVAKYRKLNVPLRTLRRAHRFASFTWDLVHPFASLKLAIFGTHVLHQFRKAHKTKASLLVLDQAGQYMLPNIVVREITHFDHDEDEDKLAQRWFPYGKAIPIVLDPRFGAGQPTVSGRGLRIETLRKRNEAGQEVESLAQDFMLDVRIVKKVLEHAA